MISKGQLQMLLEELDKFKNPKLQKEQYYTEPSLAAEIINTAILKQDLEGKVILDLGCGTGILTIGALLNGAKKVIFVDLDKDALELLQKNIDYIKENYDVELSEYEIIQSDVANLDKKKIKDKIDTVIMNPPFGTRVMHLDRTFLEKAFEFSNVVYSLHKTSTKEYVVKFGNYHNYDVETLDLSYRMKKQYLMHKKKFKVIDVSLFIFRKQ